MGVRTLVLALSLDVVTGLVFDGLVCRTIPIATASNTTPIVLTTSAPHGIVMPAVVLPAPLGALPAGTSLPGAHGVIAGVSGNASANSVVLPTGDALARVLVVVDDTHLAIYDLATVADGKGNLAPFPDLPLVPSVGSGAGSGGTVSLALTDGSILLGEAALTYQSAAPQIVILPVGSDTAVGGPSTTSTANAASRATDRARNLTVQPWFDLPTLKIRCWGALPLKPLPADPAMSYDATEALRRRVLLSLYGLATGAVKVGPGEWDTAGDVTDGRAFTFTAQLEVPIGESLISYAPSDVAPDLTIYFQPADPLDAPIEVFPP